MASEYQFSVEKEEAAFEMLLGEIKASKKEWEESQKADLLLSEFGDEEEVSDCASNKDS